MHSHRQNADISDFDDLRTHRSPWSVLDLVAVISVVLLFLGIFAVGQAVDDRSARLEAGATEVDRDEVEMAYERGIADTLAALHDGPEGIRLARTCAVPGVARP